MNTDFLTELGTICRKHRVQLKLIGEHETGFTVKFQIPELEPSIPTAFDYALFLLEENAASPEAEETCT